MNITEELLKKLLVDSGVVSEKDFVRAKGEAKEKELSLEDGLIEASLISDEELGSLLADESGFPFVNLRKTKIKEEALKIIPEIVAKKQRVIVFDKTPEGVKTALFEPDNLETREFIEKKTGEKVIPYFATRKDIEGALKYYRKKTEEELRELIEEAEKKEKGKEGSEGLPTIKMVETILNSAYENRTSDIHFEPYKDKSVLRYRIDGVLYDIATLPRFFHDPLISRIKILAKLRTDLHEASQDGHFSFDTQEGKIDARVSVVPVDEGEKAVLRLLSEKSRRFSLEDLGFEEDHLEIIAKNIKKPWGMILVSGPAGSGKTTTLYACLKILNTRKVNIMTIEDPIEYDIEGVNQIQVNPQTNLTFAEGLKAIVRQNPDIIMVGEIRDRETASLATNAAMTGHLVLSTFHAIDSGTTLTRLQEMGVEPFLITSTLNLVISQRLIRKICPKCVESYEISSSEASRVLQKEWVEKLPKGQKGKIRLFRGAGCKLCQKTGYLGRTGISEVLEISEPIKKLVMEKANASQIQKEARALGMRILLEEALKKVGEGITTLEEALRVTKE